MSSLDKDGNEIEDGFRDRRKRPGGWLEKAIKAGSVRDPYGPDPDIGADYSNATVIHVPTAEATTKGE